ncbi:MAG TPA: hypothetical protein DCF63_09870 [Planctomycetaceae bacterium]|nr:hypothetical protein [Planctomycetaceae bacterium]
MQHESGYMPPGAEIAMQRADERNAFITNQCEAFRDEYAKEALTAIERDTLTMFDECPLQAVYEHLTENDVHKLIRLAVVAKRHGMHACDDKDLFQKVVETAYLCIAEAIEEAAELEADYRAATGYFDGEE